jgi:hypothetical protein
VVRELWYKVVDYAFGKKLPFGSLWDPMFGLPRFIASWNSDGGRKGELIQTHSFLKDFGVRIPTGGGVHADFYLLPTFEEFTDRTNPLASFPRLASLLRAAETFVNTTCESLKVGSLTVSAFRPKKVGVSGQLDTEKLLGIFGNLGSKHEEFLFDHYGAFDRGPGRSVLGLMMLHDLHVGHWNPQTISLADAAPTYKQMAGSYQSPKVMHLYAQLCFGNTVVLPIDNWVETFLPAPFGFHVGNKLDHDTLFASCDVWAKLERLIWLCAQARKVHASVCADTLWCIRFGAPKVDKKMVMRGANPLACKICSTAIRDACPAYEAIEHEQVGFNGTGVSVLFNIETSAGDNTTPGQSIKSCREVGPKVTRYDTYSTRDRPADFGAFPAVGHSGAPPITVEEFLKLY